MGCALRAPLDPSKSSAETKTTKQKPDNTLVTSVADQVVKSAFETVTAADSLPRRPTHPRIDDAVNEVRQSYLSGTLNPDQRCPLDGRQMYCLIKSWKAINRNLTVTAINMFMRLFETNSEIKDLFAKFKDVETSADLRSSKVFEGHAMKVICTIDDAIVNLDDMDYVIRMLETVAESHSIRFPNFNPDFFWSIEEPFILAVKEELGDRFTISIETTYRATIRFILSTLADKFKLCRLQQQAADADAAAAKSATKNADSSNHLEQSDLFDAAK